MRVVFLGSGSIVPQLLHSIAAAGHEVVAVGANPGREIDPAWLEALGRVAPTVFSPEEAADAAADAVLLFSYAPLISAACLARTPFLNIHYALLPRYRGFHGNIWAMINDEKQFGYTLHLVDPQIDAGPIHFQHRVDNRDELRMCELLAELGEHLIRHLGDYLTRIEAGRVPTAQDEDAAIYVTRRTWRDGRINWNWPARLIFNHIRALAEITPGAFCYAGGQKITLLTATWKPREAYFAVPGKILCLRSDGGMLVKCGDSALEINLIEVGGQRIAPAAHFRRVGILLAGEGGES